MSLTNKNPSIETAVYLADHALEIVMKYKRNKRFIPNNNDFKQLELLLESLWQNHYTLEKIIKCLRERDGNKNPCIAKFCHK